VDVVAQADGDAQVIGAHFGQRRREYGDHVARDVVVVDGIVKVAKDEVFVSSGIEDPVQRLTLGFEPANDASSRHGLRSFDLQRIRGGLLTRAVAFAAPGEQRCGPRHENNVTGDTRH
jgi:hypothetical protein